MFKLSDKTPILLIGLLIVTIVGAFFSPWRDGWDFCLNHWHSQMYSLETGEPGTPSFFELHILPVIMYLLMPIVMEIADFFGYASVVVDIEENNESDMNYIFVCVLKLALYIIINHLLEKYHGKLHDEESTFTVCVDMLCIENIVIYLLNFVCYIISLILSVVDIPDTVLGVLIFLLALPVCIMALGMLMYYMSGLLISGVVPILVISLVESALGNVLTIILGIILVIIFSQIIWRLCSNYIYNKIFNMVTFHHFE